MISSQIKNKIQKILNKFETGKPEGDYSKISLFNDGPNKIKQITYGKSQTTEWGNLSKLVDLYIEKKGKFANDLVMYQGKIGKVSLVDDANLLSILKGAGHDPIMMIAQDEFFDKHYWEPASKWFSSKGFTLPLSMLVIYDSFIHSGSMLKFLRDKFPETTPVNGGDEKIWISEYTKARHKWLSNHSDKVLVKTSYRTKNLLEAIEKENWMLDEIFIANGQEIS